MNKDNRLRMLVTIQLFLLPVAFGAGTLLRSSNQEKKVDNWRLENLEKRLANNEAELANFRNEIKNLNQMLSDIKIEQGKIVTSQGHILEKLRDIQNSL